MAKLSVRIVNRLAEVPRHEWDALVGAQSPFLEWDWLSSLEEAGCVQPEHGWAPHHILVHSDERLVGACPAYLKGNSEGEFVFDHQWAHAAQQAGLAYYPKLLVAVPFTPATGTRFLTAPGSERGELIRLMGSVLIQLCRDNDISSVHVNFCRPDEREALAALGYVERVGMQYQWYNHNYATFEDYLEEFRSKRRTKIRRERREMDDLGLRIRVLTGEEIPGGLAGTIFELYQQHIKKMFWGRLYLNRAFFELVLQRFRRNLSLVLAEEDGRVIAGTFNVQKAGAYYGRYWGTQKDLRYLHFNVCYYAAIEHCIGAGLQRFEPGAGGDFKQLRGFDPTPTHSMHYLAHPALQAVATYLEQERRQMDHVIQHINAQSKLRVVREAGNPLAIPNHEG